MLFLLILTLVKANVSLVINEGEYGIYIYMSNGNYCIYTREGYNHTRYSYPIEAKVQLVYDGEYTINNHAVNIISKNGTLTPPILIQHLFRSNIIPHNNSVITMEPLQVCYDFSNERLILKIFVAILTFLLITTNGYIIGNIFDKDIVNELRVKFSKRFSKVPMSTSDSVKTQENIHKTQTFV